MKVFAYCAKEFENATRKAAGVKPLTCPPVDMHSIAGKMEWVDLIYLDLHGDPGHDYLVGSYGNMAVTADDFRELDLRGVTIFATTCYLADVGNPVLDAMLDAGALVVAGEGPNYAGKLRPAWAVQLGAWFRIWLSLGLSVGKSLALAKLRVRMNSDSKETRDTLEFKIYKRRK